MLSGRTITSSTRNNSLRTSRYAASKCFPSRLNVSSQLDEVHSSGNATFKALPAAGQNDGASTSKALVARTKSTSRNTRSEAFVTRTDTISRNATLKALRAAAHNNSVYRRIYGSCFTTLTWSTSVGILASRIVATRSRTLRVLRMIGIMRAIWIRAISLRPNSVPELFPF